VIRLTGKEVIKGEEEEEGEEASMYMDIIN
jgi:hypothetical protein